MFRKKVVVVMVVAVIESKIIRIMSLLAWYA